MMNFKSKKRKENFIVLTSIAENITAWGTGYNLDKLHKIDNVSKFNIINKTEINLWYYNRFIFIFDKEERFKKKIK